MNLIILFFETKTDCFLFIILGVTSTLDAIGLEKHVNNVRLQTCIIFCNLEDQMTIYMSNAHWFVSQSVSQLYNTHKFVLTWYTVGLISYQILIYTSDRYFVTYT